MTYFVAEFGVIRCGDVAQNVDLQQLFVPKLAFDALKKMAIAAETDAVLRFFVQKGQECLQVRNYVGLVEAPDGTQLEVLPKNAQTPAEGRATVLKMLQCWPSQRFQKLPTARATAAKLPLWEVFVAAFIEEVTQIVRRGLQKNYVATADDTHFLRGKLLVNRQITHHLFHQERFAVRFDEFSENTAPNRLLKAAIEQLQKKTQWADNQAKLRQLRFVFEQVPPSTNLPLDWQTAHQSDRRFDRYAVALEWAAVLLRGLSWVGQAGQARHWSLLFAAEALFENYVAVALRRYLSHYEVFVQEQSEYLVMNHGGEQRFKLRPDLLLRQGQNTWVIDTKWKWIDAHQTTKNYGIDQADLYQLYAYGQKYRAATVCLVYPKHAAFAAPLASFQYQNNLQLRVLPFDLTLSMSEAVAELERGLMN